MPDSSRRRFLEAAAAGALLTDFDFLMPVAQAVASDISLEPDLVQFGPDMDPLVRLVQRTPRDECVPVFAAQLKAGLSYQRFVAALFLAASQTGDLHQLAQVYAAHRISLESRMEERLIPLFWALDRVKRSHESDVSAKFFLRRLNGTLPRPNVSESALRTAITHGEAADAELAVVQVARTYGARHAMSCLWEFASRNLGGTLGHLPIGVANSWRTLSAIGWHHAEAALRYLATEIGRFPGDNTYEPNLARVEKWLPKLPHDWRSRRGSQEVTLELYGLLRNADPHSACEFICTTLASGEGKAGALWDAVTMAASDTIFRYRVGGVDIGGSLIHAVTSTNALRFGFEIAREPRIQLLHLLQAAGVTSDYFVGRAKSEGLLRDMNLLTNLAAVERSGSASFREVFDSLPPKGDNREQKNESERSASDEASRLAFALLREPLSHRLFAQTARSFLHRKATEDPHDMKYPTALFEDAFQVSPKWRPYVLASSVHALHGSQSQDSKVLVQAKSAFA